MLGLINQSYAEYDCAFSIRLFKSIKYPLYTCDYCAKSCILHFMNLLNDEYLTMYLYDIFNVA